MSEQITVPDDMYLAVGQHDETGLHHGLVYRNHKTPSGCDRWMLAVSTTTGFVTERAAGEFINGQFPHLKQLELENLSDLDELAGIPALPAGALITLMSYNEQSHDPSPEEDMPVIQVSMGGKRLDISLVLVHIRILQKLKWIELDSETDDPNLSCRYTHFYVPVATKATKVEAAQ